MSNELLSKALELAPAERYRLAFLLAENLGYTLKHNIEVMEMTEVDKEEVIIGLRDELYRSRNLRAKLEVQSMQAMDRLRAQIRELGSEPIL